MNFLKWGICAILFLGIPHLGYPESRHFENETFTHKKIKCEMELLIDPAEGYRQRGAVSFDLTLTGNNIKKTVVRCSERNCRPFGLLETYKCFWGTRAAFKVKYFDWWIHGTRKQTCQIITDWVLTEPLTPDGK